MDKQTKIRVQYFVTIIAKIKGEGLVNALQQDIESGLRLSQNNLIPGSLPHGIKILWNTGVTDITAFENYIIRMSQHALTHTLIRDIYRHTRS